MIFKHLSVIHWGIRYHNRLAKLYKRGVGQIWVENPYLGEGEGFIQAFGGEHK